MAKQVKFFWWKSYKVWRVTGSSIEAIVEKAEALCEKYHAIHFEVLD